MKQRLSFPWTLLVCGAAALAQTAALRASSPFAQQPIARPGDIVAAQTRLDMISGRVTAADTGLPLARAQVRITGPAWDRTTATDEQGRYAFRDLPPGRFRVIASRAGYVTIAYGQRTPDDPPATVTVIGGQSGSQANDHIDFVLSKSAAIVVQVLDEFGDPAEGMTVQVFRYQFANGQPRLTLVPSLERMVTDDRGMRRVFGLPPGEFAVATGIETVVSRGTTRATYERTFYPGTIDEKQAQPIVVGAGQEVSVSVAMSPPKIGPAYVIVRGFDTPPPEPGAPAPAAGATGVISGAVTSDGGLPLAHAQVTLRGAFERVAIADAGGRYAFDNLPAGRYTLSASKPGYLLLQYGRRRIHQASRPVDLEAAARLDGVDFTLPKAGAIEVVVANEMGEPLPDVRVTIRQYRFLDGERLFGSASQSVNGNLGAFGAPLTDDLGQVRVAGLAPGEYFVEAETIAPAAPPPTGFVPPDPRTAPASPPLTTGRLSTGREEMLFAETYYPGTPYVTDAVPIVLRAGEESRVIMPLAVTRAGSVTGVVTTDDGSPAAGLRLSLDQRAVPLQSDGTYTVEHVAGGEHVLAVGVAISSGPQQYARRSFRTMGDDARIDVTTKGTWTLRGRIEFDTGAQPGPLQGSVPLSEGALRSEDAGVGRVRWNPDWTFEYTGLIGPRVLRLLSDYNGWWLKSMTIGGEDVTDRPIDPGDRRQINDLRIVLSREKRASVTGDAVDSQERPVTDYSVVFFPEDPALWTPASRRLAAGRPDRQGRFEVVNLPPGRYLAAATDVLDRFEERDPTLLARLKDRATLVTLAEGDAPALRLRMLEP